MKVIKWFLIPSTLLIIVLLYWWRCGVWPELHQQQEIQKAVSEQTAQELGIIETDFQIEPVDYTVDGDRIIPPKVEQDVTETLGISKEPINNNNQELAGLVFNAKNIGGYGQCMRILPLWWQSIVWSLLLLTTFLTVVIWRRR